MRSFFLLIIPFFFFSGDIIVNESNPGASSFEKLGEAFIAAVASKKFEEILPITPGLKEWKIIAPEQMGGMTDEEIVEKIKESNLNNLHYKFNQILKAAKTEKLKIQHIEFNLAVPQRFHPDPTMAIDLEVFFFYDHFNGKFSLQVINTDGKWLLLDLDESVDPFSEIREKEEKENLWEQLKK